MRRKIITVLIIILIFAFGSLYFILVVTPKKDAIVVDNMPESYMITNENNYVQFQKRGDCAGYSSAYVLRHFGEDVEGAELYDNMSFKVGKGVSLRGVRKAFADYGYKATSYTGTIETLKMQLTKGVPVVALITINKDGHHYVAVVGYDATCIYLADSTGSSSNTTGHLEYNRRVTYEQFEELWQTNIYPVNNLYTVIEYASEVK